MHRWYPFCRKDGIGPSWFESNQWKGKRKTTRVSKLMMGEWKPQNTMMHDHVNGIGLRYYTVKTIITLPRERKTKQTEAHHVITAQGSSTEAETESAPEGNLMTPISAWSIPPSEIRGRPGDGKVNSNNNQLTMKNFRYYRSWCWGDKMKQSEQSQHSNVNLKSCHKFQCD